MVLQARASRADCQRVRFVGDAVQDVDRNTAGPTARNNDNPSRHERLDLSGERGEQLVEGGMVSHLWQHLAKLERARKGRVDASDGTPKRGRGVAERLERAELRRNHAERVEQCAKHWCALLRCWCQLRRVLCKRVAQHEAAEKRQLPDGPVAAS
eukprot:scaffold307375_cov37-Tisochrysis_lutea.AAC.2